MSGHRKGGGSAGIGPALPGPPPPPMPPPSEDERARSAALGRQIAELTALYRQRNLDWAVELAKQAARQEGPLVDHFAELGRRYHGMNIEPEKPAHKFKVIDGGAK